MGIAARLDLANAIDFQLLVLLTSNTDGITKNFILARSAGATLLFCAVGLRLHLRPQVGRQTRGAGCVAVESPVRPPAR